MQDFQYTRILSHGQITDLSQGYKADYPFSIYLRPKEGVEYQDDVLVRCRCMCDMRCPTCPWRWVTGLLRLSWSWLPTRYRWMSTMSTGEPETLNSKALWD